MTFLLALLIFLAVNTVVWFVAVAVYQSLLGPPDLRHNHDFVGVTCSSIPLATSVSLIPYPTGLLLSLGVWGLAAMYFLNLSLLRGALLFVILAALSFISRLAILGVMSY